MAKAWRNVAGMAKRKSNGGSGMAWQHMAAKKNIVENGNRRRKQARKHLGGEKA